jgi:choice-of-anchor B domain-containing protein
VRKNSKKPSKKMKRLTIGISAVALLLAMPAFAQFPCELSGGEGGPAQGGPTEIQTGQYHDNNGYYLVFDVYEPCTLTSVKVFANGTDQRSVALLSPGGDVLQAEVFDVPDGESVIELGWTLSPGTGFGLSTLSSNPQLWRDAPDSELAYPYEIGTYASITGTSVQGPNEFNYYYFFYDWHIDPTGPTVNSGGYPCDHVELMDVEEISVLGGGANGNDCWGWVEPSTSREIALYGRSSGLSLIDVTDATDMKYFGEVATATSPSLWRDVKVYGDYAFVVSEAGGHGMQVVDLNAAAALPTDQITDITPVAYYTGFGNAHNIVINEETGFAYGVGTNTFGGGLHILDIQDPLNPVLVGGYDGAYTHDAHAIVYNGPDSDYVGRELVFCFNGYSGFAVVDAEDKTDVQLISSMTYAQLGYTHQGWVSEDHTLVFMNDELDESNFGNNTRTYVVNIEDVDNPVNLGYFTSPTTAIDHNMYVRNGNLFQSNYLSGLRILSTAGAASGTLEEIGFFDTNPASDAAQFDGTWSNYPYFPSGNVAISTFTHFFMVRPDQSFMETPDAVVENPVEAMTELSVRPNPASDFLAICGVGLGGWKALEIWDHAGRLVKRWEGVPIPVEGSGEFNVDISDLREGMYFVRTEGGRAAQLVVVR